MLKPCPTSRKQPEMRKKAFLISLPLLTASCATVPSVPLETQCPRVQPVVWDAPEPDFMRPMLNFLSGNLPGPTSYELISPRAKPSMTKP